MLVDPPDPRVVELWRHLAAAPDAFEAPGVQLLRSDDARVAPRGWSAVVAIGDGAVLLVPAAGSPKVERLLDAGGAPHELTTVECLESMLGTLGDVLGPADLQYGTVTSPRRSGLRGPLDIDHPLVRAVLDASPPTERSEAGFEDAETTGCFVALDGDRPMAVAAHRAWPIQVAHIGVLTRPDARGRGWGEAAARGACAHASGLGMLVQWRSRWDNHASRRLGERLGLHRCGRQISFTVPDR